MPTIKMEIKNCKGCPHKEDTNFWSSDGWDRMFDWVCFYDKALPKKIQGSVEWHEESDIEIPDWCPILIKK